MRKTFWSERIQQPLYNQMFDFIQNPLDEARANFLCEDFSLNYSRLIWNKEKAVCKDPTIYDVIVCARITVCMHYGCELSGDRFLQNAVESMFLEIDLNQNHKLDILRRMPDDEIVQKSILGCDTWIFQHMKTITEIMEHCTFCKSCLYTFALFYTCLEEVLIQKEYVWCRAVDVEVFSAH